MHWIETAGTVSLYGLGAVVGALLTKRLLRSVAAARASGRSRVTRADRFLFEYVGNVDLDESLAATTERRRDVRARGFVEQVASAMDARRIGSAEKERFLEDLRAAIRFERHLDANGSSEERDRRFLASRRWGLAERFHALVGNAPPEIVARIKTGPDTGPGPTDGGADRDGEA